MSNFVFPVILSIFQLVFIFRNSDFFKISYIFMTAAFVEIIGVLLATIWASSSHWSDSTGTVRGATVESIPRFTPKNAASAFSSVAIPGSGLIQMKAHVETSVDSQIELGHVESHPQFSVVKKHP